MEKETELAAGSLRISESIIMGVSGAAPAFSVAATTGILFAAVGTHSPSSIFYCGLIILGITIAFMYLNRVYPNAGAAYTWISLIFNKDLGFLAGWSLLVASAIFMVSGTIPAATSTLALINPEMIDNPFWVTSIASLWLTLVCVVLLKGIRPTSYLQIIFTLIELGILVFIIISAFIYFIKQPIRTIPLESFNPFNFSLSQFAKGALISLFFFWGWDVTMNLTEETKNPDSVPGRAAIWSVIITILIFMAFVMCTLIALTDREIQESGTNVLLKVANKIFPEPWGNIALIAVVLSSVGTIETAILQFTRTIFAKSRDGALHKRWSKVHEKWQTPWISTLLIWAAGMAFLIVASFEPTVTSIINISVDVISFQVAFYYSLCGFACAWYYRYVTFKNFKQSFLLIVWPIFSSLVLITIAIYGAVTTFALKAVVLGIGGILIGIIPLLLNKRKPGTVAV